MILAGVFDTVSNDIVTDFRSYPNVDTFRRDISHFMKNPMMEWRNKDMIIITYQTDDLLSSGLTNRFDYVVDDHGQLVPSDRRRMENISDE